MYSRPVMSSPRPPLRPVSGTTTDGTASANHSRLGTPRQTPLFDTPSSFTPPRAATRLPPLQASRADVPLGGVVAAHAPARVWAQPAVASTAATTATTSTPTHALERGVAKHLDVDHMESRDESDPMSGSAPRGASTGRAHYLSALLSPSMSAVRMPPSPAYTIAPGTRADESSNSMVPSTRSASPNPADGSDGAAEADSFGRELSGGWASSARKPPAVVSARRPGPSPVTRVPSTARQPGSRGKKTAVARRTEVPAGGSSATARLMTGDDDRGSSARLAASVRKATRAWMYRDEAAPLSQRHHLAPTAVTVQDRLLTESGGGRPAESRTEGGFAHVLDMTGTTAQSYLGLFADADVGFPGEDTLEGTSQGRAEEAFAMTAPASVLLLTTDSGARYDGTIHSLADLDATGSLTPRAGQLPLTRTMTPPPHSSRVVVTPGSPGLQSTALLSTEPAPPRWAGTLTSDRLRDYPREVSLAETSGAAGSRLPPIDATASELAALSVRARRDPDLARTWASTVRDEERDGAKGSLELARALFYYVIRSHPSHHLFVDGGTSQMLSLACHVAVSSLLLDQLVVHLPRHHAVLIPYVQMLLRHVYVPDTPGVREALDGTVMDEAVLEGLLARCESYHDQCVRGGSISQADGRGDSVVARAGGSLLGHTTPEALLAMLLPYARKPFFLAHLSLSQRVVGIAHRVRCREAQFRRLPDVIDKMQASCSKSLLRTVMRLWSRLCRDRRLQERKLRQRWARRWAAERLSTGIRRWREYASDVLKTAEVSTLLRRQISESKGTIDRLHANTEAMQRKTQELNVSLLANEVARQQMTLESAAAEQTYKETLERVRELDQVGTSLLEGLLLTEPLPVRPWGPSAEEVSHPPDAVVGEGSAREGGVAHVQPPLTLSLATPARLQPPLAYLGALQVMVVWGNQLMAQRGCDTEMLCLMPPSPADDAVGDGGLHKPDEAANAKSPPTSSSPVPAPAVASQFAEAELKAQLGATFNSLLDPAAPLMSVPLYKFLVLMRAFGEDDLNVPTLAVTRLVKAADEQILPQLVKLQTIDEAAAAATAAATTGPSGGARVAGEAPPASVKATAATGLATAHTATLMDRLPDSVKASAETITSILVDCYEQLTGSVCVVTAAQLCGRRRQFWLVFLAGLFRHYTNWIIRKGQSDMANLQAEMDALDAADNHLVSRAAAPAAAMWDEKRHLGRRHPQNDAWYYPPQQHRRWLPMVQQQQEWIAGSLNALHCAVEEAQRPERLLTIEEQESWGRTLQCIPVTAVSDLLPAQPTLSSGIYVSVLRVLEQHYSQLRLVFSQYAIPYADIVEQRRLWQRQTRDRRLRELRRLGATAAELAAMRREAEEEDESTGEREFAEVPMPVMPQHAFWGLLCTAGLAGCVAERNPPNAAANCPQPTADAFTTLHRPAVFSIVEHVTQRALIDSGSGEPGAHSSANVRTSFATAGIGHRRSEQQAVADAEAEATRRRGRAMCYLGKTTVMRLGGYTRAVREGRHVDLRDDSGLMCLTLPQFLEAFIRCVHAWVALNAQPPAADPVGEGAHVRAGLQRNSEAEGAGRERETTRRNSLMHASTRGSLANDSSTDFPPASRDGNRSRQMTPAVGSRQGSLSSGVRLGGGESSTTSRHRRPRVAYEPYTDDHESVQPATVSLALREHLLPSVLGARSMASSSFELACRRPALARFFALHHEPLFKVFDQFSEPIEAVGMVRALPLPLCQYVAESVVAPTTATATTGVGLADGASARQSSASRPTTAHRQSSAASRRTSAAGTGRDVGIVAVLTVENAVAMAKQLQWGEGAGLARRRRLAPSSIQHCLLSVVADRRREGEVLFFSEFWLFLCAVAQFVDPNPRTPLDIKVSSFVLAHVVRAAGDDDDGGESDGSDGDASEETSERRFDRAQANH